MATSLSADRVETAARQLLDSRIQAVRTLAAARQHRDDKRDEAERADTTAYHAAQRAGWTTEELRNVGLDAPDRRPRGRPRHPRTTERDNSSNPSQ